MSGAGQIVCDCSYMSADSGPMHDPTCPRWAKDVQHVAGCVAVPTAWKDWCLEHRAARKHPDAQICEKWWDNNRGCRW